MAKSSKLTWDDLYFDSKIDYLYEDFCEETQEVVRTRVFMMDREATLSSEARREAEIDEYYLALYSGKLKRIR